MDTPVSNPTSQPSSPMPTQGNGGGANSTQDSSQNSPLKAAQLAASPPEQQTSSKPDVYEVKVNGKVVNMTREEVIAHASMSSAANSRFEEAARTKKQIDKIISTAKSNPIEVLMDPALGLSKDQIRDAFEKWYTQEFIEPETLTPEQRRMKELESRISKYEKEENEKVSKEKADQEEQLTSRQREHLQGQIIEAIDQSGLPKTKFIAQRMAFYMRENLVNGWDAPLSMIVSQVKKERQAMMSDLVESADGEVLINMLGDGVVQKIRSHDLKQLREKRKVPSSFGGSPTPSDQPDEKISYREVNDRLRKLKQQGF
jgi:hypothetical protein